VLKDSLSFAKILVVDDDPAILRLCESILRSEGYSNIVSTPDARGVLSLFVEYDPDILILDIAMPHLDGIQILDLLQKSAPEGLALPVLMMTAMASPAVRLQALSRGAVDVLSKPFPVGEFALRVRNLLIIRMAVHDAIDVAIRDAETQNRAIFDLLLDRTEELSSSQLELREAQLEVIARLARAGEQHDDETGQHTQRVAVTSGLLAQELKLDAEEVNIIQHAAPLHDVGKIGITDSVLLKPGRFTEQEYEIMRQHCVIGSQLLSGGRSEIVRMAECIALHHHEKWNGEGYPHGLAGDNIPIEGRILAVADVFDALTHARPYKKAWSVPDALAEIRRQSGQQFDPRIVTLFLQLPHDELI